MYENPIYWGIHFKTTDRAVTSQMDTFHLVGLKCRVRCLGRGTLKVLAIDVIFCRYTSGILLSFLTTLHLHPVFVSVPVFQNFLLNPVFNILIQFSSSFPLQPVFVFSSCFEYPACLPLCCVCYLTFNLCSFGVWLPIVNGLLGYLPPVLTLAMF